MLLTVTSLRKAFAGQDAGTEVLADVSFDLAAGKSLALTGESGSGKSTLLHIVGGLETADGGRVALNGQDISRLDDTGLAAFRRKSVGLVFQHFNLIPSLDTAANIAFQAHLAGRHDKVWCAELADRLGLTEHLKKFPEQLSGGQQQRVAIGRSLAARPALLLADEPTGNLDEATGDAVLDLMLGLVRAEGVALLMVTHSMRLAERLDRRLTLAHGRLT